MNKIIFVAALFFSMDCLSQGSLYGVTLSGGTSGGGTIFQVTASGIQTKVDFQTSYPGLPYRTNLTKASNGKLYGVSYGKGKNNRGGIFEYDPLTNTYKFVHDFDIDYVEPLGNFQLVEGTNGKLYGITNERVFINQTTVAGIYEFSPITGQYQILKSFPAQTDARSIMMASDGRIYGITNSGGSHSNGSIFSYDLTSQQVTSLYSFDGPTGSFPVSAPMEASDGNLYGVTGNGGANGVGVIYRFNKSNNTFTKLFSMSQSGNYFPVGPMVEVSTGVLFGVNGSSSFPAAGSIFKYDIATGTYTDYPVFSAPNGRIPVTSLMKASNGKLYGLTTQGGASGFGTLYEFDPSNGSYAVKYNFGSATSSFAHEKGTVLAEGLPGKLYGVIYDTERSPALFEYTIASGTFAKKFLFNSSANGTNPAGTLLKTTTGKVYGVNSWGGSNSAGTIFEFDINLSSIVKATSFPEAAGANPDGAPIELNGKLYGVCQNGGANDAGTIYSFDPGTSTFTGLYSFASTGNSGYSPSRTLTVANNKLYGFTRFGGIGAGTLFEFDPTSNAYVVKYDFSIPSNGQSPRGSMILGKNNKLYGTTNAGGANGLGVLFEFDPATSAYNKKADLSTTTGYHNFGPLAAGSDGTIYISTGEGGQNVPKSGTLLSYTPATGTLTKLSDIGSNGASTSGVTITSNLSLITLVQGAGTTFQGVYNSFDIAHQTTQQYLFTGTNGTLGGVESLIELTSVTGDINRESGSSALFPNPASDYITVQMPQAIQGATLIIQSSTGAIMGRQLSLQREERLFIGDLQAGVYILSIIFNEHSEHIKFIKY